MAQYAVTQDAVDNIAAWLASKRRPMEVRFRLTVGTGGGGSRTIASVALDKEAKDLAPGADDPWREGEIEQILMELQDAATDLDEPKVDVRCELRAGSQSMGSRTFCLWDFAAGQKKKKDRGDKMNIFAGVAQVINTINGTLGVTSNALKMALEQNAELTERAFSGRIGEAEATARWMQAGEVDTWEQLAVELAGGLARKKLGLSAPENSFVKAMKEDMPGFVRTFLAKLSDAEWTHILGNAEIRELLLTRLVSVIAADPRGFTKRLLLKLTDSQWAELLADAEIQALFSARFAPKAN